MLAARSGRGRIGLLIRLGCFGLGRRPGRERPAGAARRGSRGPRWLARPAECDQQGAGGLWGALGAEPAGAEAGDQGDVGEGFDVVDQGGAAGDAAFGGTGWFGGGAGVGGVEVVDQCGFLAGDVAAGHCHHAGADGVKLNPPFLNLLGIPQVPQIPRSRTDSTDSREPHPAPGGRWNRARRADEDGRVGASGASPAGRLRLLLVEDEPELATMLARILDEDGYDVDVATDGQRGLHLALTRRYEVVVLDRRLPGLEGLDLLGRLRRQGVATPALVLSALGNPADRVAGLDAGAEDYLAKPFDVDDLLARLRALRRRHLDSARVLPLSEGRLNLDSREVTGPRLPVRLSERECGLLAALAARPAKVSPGRSC